MSSNNPQILQKPSLEYTLLHTQNLKAATVNVIAYALGIKICTPPNTIIYLHCSTLLSLF